MANLYFGNLAPGNSFDPAEKNRLLPKIASLSMPKHNLLYTFYTFLDAFQIESDAIRI